MASVQSNVSLLQNEPLSSINQTKIMFIEVFSENISKNYKNVQDDNVDALVSLFFQESVYHIKLLAAMANTTLAEIGSLSRK